MANNDLANLKEQALERKRAHMKKQLEAEVAKSRRASNKRTPARRSRNSAASTQAEAAKPAKKKTSVSKIAIEVLLVLGAILVLVFLFNPF